MARALLLASPMPSQEHEALVDLFRAAPSLVARLLDDVGVDVSGVVRAEVVDSSFSAIATDYHADCVVELCDANGDVRLVAVVEVQLAEDADKRRSWPVYETTARARHRAPACVAIFAPDPDVATWAAAPVLLGPSGSTFRAIVLDAIPCVTDVAAARATPELAVLSAIAYGKGDRAVAVAMAAHDALAVLPDDRTKLYLDLMMAALGEAARRALEAMMDPAKWVYKSDFARKYIAQGKAEGRAEAKAEALLDLLAARGLAISDEQRAEISACTDEARLRRWLRAALSVESVGEVLGTS